MNILGKLKEKASEICYNLEVKKMLVKERLQEAKEDNRGIAVIEIILILVIILGLIIIFRKNLKEMIDKIFKQINGDRDKILKKGEGNESKRKYNCVLIFGSHSGHSFDWESVRVIKSYSCKGNSFG